MGLFDRKQKAQPVYIVNANQPEKKSFTQSLFGKKDKKSEAFSREWRASCKVKRYPSFVIRARDSQDAEDKLYKKIKEENYPQRYYWNLEEITLE